MRDFFQTELDKCRELLSLINQVKQLESNELSALSSRVDHSSNKRDIITLPNPPVQVKVPGIISPYLSKVSVPSESGPKSSIKSKMRSSIDSGRKMSSLADKTNGMNPHIIEMRHSQNAKARYEQHNALINA